MTEGDYVIIAGLAYAAYALAFWLYILRKEGKPYNPFTRHSVPRVPGAAFGLTGMLIGLAVAPAVAWGLLMLYLRARYGREDCPLLLSKVPGSDKS